MKLLVLLGSGRKNGNTDMVTQIVVKKIAELAAQQGAVLEIETLSLAQQDIEACRGCRSCFDRGEDTCPVKDDMPVIREKMRAADGLLVASPVYVDDVNGITKNWIDRTAYACHRPEFAGKCAFGITTVGSTPSRHANGTLSLALSTWGYHIVGVKGFSAGALLKKDEALVRYEKEAEKIARSLLNALFEKQGALPTFRSLITFKIQQSVWQNEPPGTFDHSYWQNQGWLDKDRTFYIHHRSHPLKTGLARVIGAVIKPLVT